MINAEVLSEISNWSIEAKEEDTSKYFYHFSDVSAIESGRKSYVIGRKGTGKTAIAEYINEKVSHKKFSRLLSFKNFPFNNLYNYSDDQYNRPNQYITIWTYVILYYLCSMMAENEAVYTKCTVDLRKYFDFEVDGALSQSVRNITDTEYSVNIFGIGGGIKNNSEKKEFDFVKANEKLERFVKENIDNSEYYIIFDELDEDYRDVLDPDRKDGYFELLISLFKAVQIVRSIFSNSDINVRPIIFLRDDIFDLCRDVDKNKWLDRAVTLRWDMRQLRNLINFRLSQALLGGGQDTSTDKAWRQVFSVESTGLPGGKKMETFKYICSRTFLRPRDVISYVRECAATAIANDHRRIGNSDIKEAIEGHSAYMRREVIDELFPVLDDVSEVLDVLTKIRKQIFTRKEFNDRYREFLNQSPGHKRNLSSSQVLKLLYHFNVLGNITTANHRVFAYNSNAKSMNMDENLCVHHGLIYSLSIL